MIESKRREPDRREEGADDFKEALYAACTFDHLSLIELLLNYSEGINFNEYLAYTCEYERSEIVKLLIKNGATYCSYCKRSAKEH